MSGLTGHGLKWVATAVVVGNWHPLTMLSLQLDAQLFGTEPLGFHRTSVVIHAINAVLVYLMLLSLTGCQVRSLLVAAFFALHPLRVESVSWVSERKDVLSGFFFCLSILAYVYYVRSPSIARNLLVICCLALGLCSKPMLVTTPCVLLLLDYWPLTRFQQAGQDEMPRFWQLFIEKLPLFALSAIFSLITLTCQEPGIQSLSDVTLSGRIGTAVAGYAAYLFQTFYPTGLRPFYPMPDVSTFDHLGEAALLVLVSGLAVWQRKNRPYLFVGWFWFVGMLVPVSGLMQTGGQARADRYTYLPHIGLFLALIWSLAEFAKQRKWVTTFLLVFASALLVACGWLTLQQIPVWRNTESLFRRVYRYSPENTMVIQGLINTLIQTGKSDEALKITQEALSNVDETDRDQMIMLAMLLAVQHQHVESEKVISRALKHHPGMAELYSNRGKIRAALGKWPEAVDDFREASQLAPRNHAFKSYIAHALGKTGDHEGSRRLYAEVLKRSPDWPTMAAQDAWRMSTSADAREHVNFWPECLAEQALEALNDPSTSAPFLDVLAAAYAHDGKFEEAIATARRAIVISDSAGQLDFSALIRRRLADYEQHRPYREILVGVRPTP